MLLKDCQRSNHVHRPLQYRIVRALFRTAPLLANFYLGIGPGDKGRFIEMWALGLEYKIRESTLRALGEDLMFLCKRQFHRQVGLYSIREKRSPIRADHLRNRH